MVTNIETTIKSVLAELLDVAPQDISSTATFAELGMDSLIGLRFAKKLKVSLAVEIEFEWLFDYPNVAQLSQFLASHEAHSLNA